MEDFQKKIAKNKALNMLGVVIFWSIVLSLGWLIFGNHGKDSNTNSSAQAASLAPTIAACDRLPMNYIAQVMSSTITNKQESSNSDGPGTNCWVQGTIANGPDWLLSYTVVPTASATPTTIDKQSDDTGWWYEYQSGRYKGTLIFTTKGTSPADDQIAHDLTDEIAKSLTSP